MDENGIQKLTRDKCIEKLKETGQKCSRNFGGKENETRKI